MPGLFGGRMLGPGGLMSGGTAQWWPVAGKTCVIAYQPKGAASLAASYVNLATPGTYDATVGVAPTIGADGWIYNNAAWLSTGIYYGAGWTAIVRCVPGIVSGVSMAFGMYDSGNTSARLDCRPKTANGVMWTHGNRQAYRLPDLTAGVLALANGQPYRDGIADGAPIGTFIGTSARDISIGCMNDIGVPHYCFTGTIQAIAFYSDTLTDGEVAALSAHMAAL